MKGFKSCVRLDVHMHLIDRGEEDAHRTAVLADDLVISHQFAKLSSDVKPKQSRLPDSSASTSTKSNNNNEKKASPVK
jgi:hypothetical protein